MQNVKGAASDDPRGLLDHAVTALTTIVIVSRLLTPTEGASQGETLWITQLTLLTLLVWAFATFRAGAAVFRLDRLDAGVLLLVGGHLISAGLHWSSADRRATCNMFWEWCGLAGTWFLARRIAANPVERRALTGAILALSVALAGFGIWQHYFGLASMRGEVARIQSEWDALEASGEPTDPRAAHQWSESRQRLTQELVRNGIPVEGGARKLWEQRINESTEPFGMFGLANSFAGVLAVSLLLWLAFILSLTDSTSSRVRMAAAGSAGLLVAYCLLLTKSRTAYVGVTVGVLVWLAGARRLLTPSRKLWFWTGIVAACLAVLAATAVLTGAVDHFVFSESFKSLRYRGEYWIGTWRMMTDSVLRTASGVGPGNFRAYYLQYKLPESSEEIADPHNLILDVWAGGGLLSVAGLFLLLAQGLRLIAGACDFPVAAEIPGETKPRRRHQRSKSSIERFSVPLGAVFAFFVVYGVTFDDRMIPLLLGSVAAAFIAAPLFQRDIPAMSYAVAVVTLAVHLLGAGGIEMPAICQLLLWLVATAAVACPFPAWIEMAISARGAILAGVATLALYLGCWFSATYPVMNARAERAAGEQAWLEEGRIEKAERAYKQAAAADPLDADACEWLSRLFLQQWMAGRKVDDETFETSAYWQRQAMLRQPRNYGVYRVLGSAYLTRFDRTKNPDDAALAADEFARAIELYPNHAELQSEMAEALWRAEQLEAARSFAERASELDAINRQFRHLDKQLSEERRDLMKTILATQPDSPEKVKESGVEQVES